MRRGAQTAAALCVLALLFVASGVTQTTPEPPEPDAGDAPLTPQAEEPEALTRPHVQRFSIDPRESPIRVGDVVPIHVVVDPAGPAERLQIHVTADRASTGLSRDDEIEPAPLEPSARPTIQVGFWEPSHPGRYDLHGHVHLDGQVIELPPRSASVQPAAGGEQVQGSSLQVGIAPGTVLWSLVFMGLAYVAQRRTRGDED